MNLLNFLKFCVQKLFLPLDKPTCKTRYHNTTKLGSSPLSLRFFEKVSACIEINFQGPDTLPYSNGKKPDSGMACIAINAGILVIWTSSEIVSITISEVNASISVNSGNFAIFAQKPTIAEVWQWRRFFTKSRASM